MIVKVVRYPVLSMIPLSVQSTCQTHLGAPRVCGKQCLFHPKQLDVIYPGISAGMHGHATVSQA